MILLACLFGLASSFSIMRYIFPVWEMNTYDSGIVTAKNNVTVLEDRLNFYSTMQKVNLGHTIISCIGTLGMAAVACVVAPIPGTIGAASFGLYAGYHGIQKWLSSVEITQTQFKIGVIKKQLKLEGKYVEKLHTFIPDFFYNSDLLGVLFVAAIAICAWKIKVHEIKEWKDMTRVFGLLVVVVFVLVCIGFLQTIQIVQNQTIARRNWLESEIDNRCNILKMPFMLRLRYEALSLFGAVVDDENYVHNSACDALTEEYSLTRGDLLTISGRCLARAFKGVVIKELIGEIDWKTKWLLLVVLAGGTVFVFLRGLAVHPDAGVLGPSIRVAAIGLIVFVFLKMLSIV